MKKKIFSLILGICLIFGGLFAFSGCSLVPTDQDKVNGKVVMKIGDKNVTEAELINAFYTYYQNNSNYFAYYDEETIEESFYTWYIVKTMVNELSYKALNDGTIYYTNKDAETVWGYVEDYFYNQVSAYEKSLYVADGVEEADYPTWLQTEAAKEEPAKFESYKSPTDAIEFTDRAAEATKKLTAQEVYEKVAALKADLFKYVVSTDDEGVETKENIVDEPFKVRNQAYANYIQALVSNAKAAGKSTDIDDVLNSEIYRIYEAYYDSQINVIFQNYYVQDQLLNRDGQGDPNTLNASTVVAKFLDKYYLDMQTNQIQDVYVKTMESSDGASLVTYHYKGRYYYFSVQHILVKFSDYVLEQVEALPGYGVNDANEIISDNYVDARDDIATDRNAAILTKVNTDAMKDSLIAVGDYYYFDESQKTEWDPTNNIYYGYIKLTNHTINYVDGTVNYTETYTEASPYVAGDGTEITKDSDGVVQMATYVDVQNAFKLNYGIWLDLAEEIFTNTTEQNANKIIDDFYAEEDGEHNKINEKYEEMRYVLEVARDMKINGLTLNDVKSKVSSLLFVELEWIYSGDSLGNEISNKIGYIVSNEPDENMNWVVDFAVGARAMIEEMNKPAFESKTAEEKALYTQAVITDYGYHIMKIENVYDAASIIDLESITDEFSLNVNSAYIQKVAKLLKQNYVCAGSNQSLYDYFYDEAYNTLVGTSSSAGTYFLALEYEWLSKYYDDNKIEIIEKVPYADLFASLS